MESTAQGKAGREVTFEIEGQLAGQVTNVGGDQNTFLGEGQVGSVFGRTIAVLGLIVSVAGLGFLVVGGIETGRAMIPAPPDWADYKSYVAMDRLTVGLTLIVVGIVVGKVGRLFARR
jgi:F0F1-type ATP synthase membrane subunit c/vacuolar-type H+-ATPase subunit K